MIKGPREFWVVRKVLSRTKGVSLGTFPDHSRLFYQNSPTGEALALTAGEGGEEGDLASLG
ncbi:hypothetical protein GCM10007100_10100 [Roseibacillus persicicus]|uniref:Uncharacterized protein n=1 Tax=Roseibacillus persicicus TaxID=454148 RepID=A0A918THN3_9BACT|nr:hypothetical protein GCM10007100_10100 [Roseibacillus persicicus]